MYLTLFGVGYYILRGVIRPFLILPYLDFSFLTFPYLSLLNRLKFNYVKLFFYLNKISFQRHAPFFYLRVETMQIVYRLCSYGEKLL